MTGADDARSAQEAIARAFGRPFIPRDAKPEPPLPREPPKAPETLAEAERRWIKENGWSGKS
jgi:hypothetical protein